MRKARTIRDALYPEASPGFFSGGGGTPRPFKGYHAPLAGAPGGEGPPDGSDVSLFKTIRSIRK